MKLFRYSLLLLALVAMSGVVFAQRGQCQGCGNYDPATEATVTGVVEEVVHVPAPGRGPGGIHVMLRGDAAPFEVRLGPVSYLRAQRFEVSKGDTLTVVGSKQTSDGRDVIIAREVTKDGMTLTLRNAKGVPAWSGAPTS